MDEQNQNEGQSNIEKQGTGEQIAKQAMEAGKDALKQKRKQEAKKLGAKLMAKLMPLIIAIAKGALIVAAISIIAGILFAAFDWFIDTFVADRADEISSDMVGTYATVDDTGIHFDKEAMLTLLAKEFKDGSLDYNSLGFGNDEEFISNDGDIDLDKFKNSQAAEYLYRFMSASLTTEFPYIPGSDKEAQGCVYIKRKKNETEEAKALEYIGYQNFQSMLQSSDKATKEKALNYFSLDESWNLCIAKYYRQIIEKSSNGNVTSREEEYTVTEVKIPYRTMISQYSVPFTFLINLEIESMNANYVDAFVDLIQESEIEFTIFDSVTTDTNVYEYMATRNTKSPKEVPIDGESIEGGMRTTIERSENPVDDKTTTITEIDTIKANVTKAKTWILEQETNYAMQTTKEYPFGTQGTTNTLPNEEEPNPVGSWDTGRSEYLFEEIIINEWMKSGDTKTAFTPSQFLGLWSNETGRYVQGAPYMPSGPGKSGKVVKYTLPGGTALISEPGGNFTNDKEALYGRLSENVRTQTYAEIMKYLIEFYISKEEITDMRFLDSFKSMYEPSEYIESSYTGDFDVHDESLFITDLEELKKALAGGYSRSERLVQNAQAFLDMQEKYKVNALFAASVSITETSAGWEGHAVDGCNNWFNITGTNGPYKTTVNKKDGEIYHWRIYSSPAEGIDAFGNLIANGSYYYQELRFTVGTIAQRYCPNSDAYPTQADDWKESTIAQISRFYDAVGINADEYITGGGAGAGRSKWSSRRRI